MPLTPYVPLDRLVALLEGRSLPDRALGAALFADLAGSTAFAERLARELGPQRGAEELTRQLNRVYAVLTGEVEQFGGSVLSFSGDAITCWFDGGAAPADGARRALAAALAMQRGMAALAPVPLADGSRLALGVKIAVAGGPIRRLAIGEPALGRLDVLAGATLDLLSALEQLARRDEVLVDAATARALGPELVVAEWRAGPVEGVVAARVLALAATVRPAPLAPPPPSPRAEAAARLWLLPTVARRIAVAAGATADPLLADLRRVAALFLGFRGIDYDGDEDAPVLLDAFVRRVQAVAATYDGSLLQLTMGDKGSYLYIAFGAPVAQSNAGASAVAAALELLALPARLGYVSEARIGIAQGQMYCGDYGGPNRRTYGVLGDATNVAARLMSLARPGTIACDEGVYRAARRRWHFAELSPVVLKGKDRPVPIYTPVGPRARPTPAGGEPALLGREAELRRCAELLARLRAGAGGVLTITGEAGVGKSLLAAALAREAAAGGTRAVLGTALINEQQTPYRAWRDILEALLGLEAAHGPEGRRALAGRAVAVAVPYMAERAPLLNDVLHLGLPETPLTVELDARLRQESLRGLVSALLGARLREGPLLLLVEDAHWLDALSWLLVVGVARDALAAGAPLLLALVHRPAAEAEAFAPHLETLRGLPGAAAIALDGLGDEPLTALTARRLGLAPPRVPEDLRAMLAERSGGNPFFAEELIDNLRDGGLVAVVADAGGEARCVLSPDLLAGRAPLPATVEGLVLARIDRLPAEQQLLLKVAAVIGRSFGEPPLYAALTRHTLIERGVLRAYLESLTRRDLTMIETREPEAAYAFKHSVTHRVAYETLLFRQRAELHRAVALWYEEAHAGRLEAYYPLLAHHYRMAGDEAREARFAALAGLQAAALYANEDALAYLGRAIELVPADEPARRFDLLLAREQVYDMLARREAQAADVRALEALAERLDDGARRVTAALRRALFCDRVSDFEAGAAAARAAAALAVARADVVAEAEARHRWGAILWKQARYAEAREQLEGALAIARAWGLPLVEAQSLYTLASVTISRGDQRGAGLLFAAALEIARAIGNRRQEANCLTALSVVASFTGDYAGARDLNLQALAIFRAIGDRQGEAFGLNNLADDHITFGDYLAARECQEQALALFRTSGSWEGEGWTLRNMGEVATQLGEYERAEGSYRQALAIARAVGGAEDESDTLRHLATVAHLRGDDAQALALGEEAARVSGAIGYARGRGYALTVVGHAQLGLGRADAAAAAYEAALALRAGAGETALVYETTAGLARVALARGRPAEALALVEPILAHLADAPLTGADEPARVELTCYAALRAAGDPRAEAALAAAVARLRDRAARIGDEGLRQRFLTAVTAHRELLAEA